MANPAGTTTPTTLIHIGTDTPCTVIAQPKIRRNRWDTATRVNTLIEIAVKGFIRLTPDFNGVYDQATDTLITNMLICTVNYALCIEEL
jgi:hypothetical protein